MQHRLNMMCFPSHRHACLCKIDDIKPIIQSSHVCIKHVYDSLQVATHVHMSGMHMPNLDDTHFQSAYTQIVSQR